MTTIAWDGRILAADSRATSRGGLILPENAEKVWKGPSGHLAATCGSVTFYGEMFVDWLLDGCRGKPPRMNQVDAEECTFVLINPDGAVFELADRGFIPVRYDAFYAWGAGKRFALGAMGAGADAVKAVKVASMFCCYTDDRIQFVEADFLTKKKKS